MTPNTSPKPQLGQARSEPPQQRSAVSAEGTFVDIFHGNYLGNCCGPVFVFIGFKTIPLNNAVHKLHPPKVHAAEVSAELNKCTAVENEVSISFWINHAPFKGKMCNGINY